MATIPNTYKHQTITFDTYHNTITGNNTSLNLQETHDAFKCMQTINRDAALYTKTGTTKTDGYLELTHEAFTNLHQEATEHLRNDRDRKKQDRNNSCAQLLNGDNEPHGTRMFRFMRGGLLVKVGECFVGELKVAVCLCGTSFGI